MKIKTFAFNPFSTICYIVSNEKNEAIVIDPGCLSQVERNNLCEYIDNNQLYVKKIVCTHLHLDHIFGCRYISEKYHVDVYGNKKDEPMLRMLPKYMEAFGIANPEGDAIIPELSKYLSENETIGIDGVEFNVIEIAGHTDGHIALYSETDKIAFVGDIIFRGSIGRTDLNGRNPQEMQKLLISGITDKLLTLPAETILYPGHGPSTTVGYEMTMNPYL